MHGISKVPPSSEKANPQGCPKMQGAGKPKNEREQSLQSSCYSPDRYDYSLVKYRGNKPPVEIFCPTKGALSKRPKFPPITTNAARLCGRRSAPPKTSSPRHARVWGDKYYYGRLNVRVNMRKVSSTCRDHGIFMQRRALTSDRFTRAAQNATDGETDWPPSLRAPRSTTAIL